MVKRAGFSMISYRILKMPDFFSALRADLLSKVCPYQNQTKTFFSALRADFFVYHICGAVRSLWCAVGEKKLHFQDRISAQNIENFLAPSARFDKDKWDRFAPQTVLIWVDVPSKMNQMGIFLRGTPLIPVKNRGKSGPDTIFFWPPSAATYFGAPSTQSHGYNNIYTGLILYRIERNGIVQTSCFVTNFVRICPFSWFLHYLFLHNILRIRYQPGEGFGRT